jgi:hypothetical protein
VKSLLGLAVFGFITTLGLGGCKQGLGDRCQVQDDCKFPLVCNIATKTCQGSTGTGDIDATVPDAPPGTKFDAAPDATPDAMPGSGSGSGSGTT